MDQFASRRPDDIHAHELFRIWQCYQLKPTSQSAVDGSPRDILIVCSAAKGGNAGFNQLLLCCAHRRDFRNGPKGGREKRVRSRGFPAKQLFSYDAPLSCTSASKSWRTNNIANRIDGVSSGL